MSEINTTNIDTENSEFTDVYLTDSEDKYLLDKFNVYLKAINEKESDIMSTKKYVSLEKLGLYDEKIKKYLGDADSVVLQSAKDYADGLATDYDVAGAAKTVQDNLDAEVLRAKAAEEANAAAAKKAQDEVDALELVVADKAAQSDLDALENYVGAIPESATSTNVIAYVQEKTAGIATSENLQELTNRVAQAETDIDNIEKDYLKATDKTELEGKITAAQTAVDTEKGRAEGIEAGLRTDVDAIKGDYLKAADKTELQNNINTVSGAVERLTNGVSTEEIDGVNDLIQYVKDHGTEVTGMQGDIAQNTSDIAGVAGRVTTAEGKITTLEGDVAKKVDQTAYDEKIAALEGADSGLDTRLKAVEAKFGDGEGNVEAQIEAAKTAAIEAAAQDAASKDAALKTEIETAYKNYADDEDAKIESRVDALEGDIHTHGNKALLDTYTQTEANLADAVAKKHEHANAAVINAITSDDVTTWNTVTSKATQADLEAAVARIAANETAIANFVEVSEQEILDLFK